MENQPTTDRFIRQLAQAHRVLTLGGVAVIAHGLDRNTHDGDIWLDPEFSSFLSCTWGCNSLRS